MRRLLLIVFALVLTSVMASAGSLCTGDVLLLPGGTCDFGGLTFGGFSVQPTIPPLTAAHIFIGSLSSVGADGTVFLDFRVTTQPNMPTTAADIILNYWVKGPTDGIDLSLSGGVSVAIGESVCATSFDPQLACPGGLLANYAAGPGDHAVAMFDKTYDTVYIRKDIQFGENSQGAFISDFFNSHHVPVPEPISFVLMGSGLLGLGLLRRKIRS